MRTKLIITTAITFAVAAFFYSGVFSALLIFVLMGRVPGTSYMFSADFMAGMMTMIGLLLLARFASWSFIKIIHIRPKHEPVKLPRRRYARSAQV